MVATAVAALPAAAIAWREAPAHLALFTPAAHRHAYTASVSAASLDAVIAEAAADPAAARTPGSWTARSEAPLDVFGRSGGYNRWQLARLYGARSPRVARGARRAAGGVVESWTLVSPYPSSDLSRLEPGTLRLVLRIAP